MQNVAIDIGKKSKLGTETLISMKSLPLQSIRQVESDVNEMRNWQLNHLLSFWRFSPFID